MTGLVARAGASLGLFVAASLPVVGLPTAACAASGPQAALVIDAGDRGPVYRYCVALPDGSVSGIELIELAAEQHGVTYRFDSGAAVCMLQEVGSTEGECFGEYPDFWGYWRGTDSGGWTWSSGGAASTRVEDGDVEGWSWGRGADGSGHAPPPPTTHASVCGDRPEPEPTAPHDEREPRPRPAPAEAERTEAERDAAPAPVPAISADTEDERERQRASQRERGRRVRDPAGSRKYRYAIPLEPSRKPSIAAEPIAAAAGDDAGGPPAAGLAGIVGAVALCVGAGMIARRRAGKS